MQGGGCQSRKGVPSSRDHSKLVSGLSSSSVPLLPPCLGPDHPEKLQSLYWETAVQRETQGHSLGLALVLVCACGIFEPSLCQARSPRSDSSGVNLTTFFTDLLEEPTF